MTKVNDLFEVNYGVNLELNALKLDPKGINFVSRTKKNNGVSAKVEKINNIEPIPAGTISVAGGGSVMESFLQSEPYYSGRDLYYLIPKVKLSDAQKLFYCQCLRLNKFKFSFGRQSNSTLKELSIPSVEELPTWVNSTSLRDYEKLILKNLSSRMEITAQVSNKIELVELTRLFTLKNGLGSNFVTRSLKQETENHIPYLRPSYRQETSIDAYINKLFVEEEYIFPKETLYVSTDGQGSHSYAYVSVFEFVPNSNITVLLPKRKMNIQEKLFYSNCISRNRYKFSYGRKPKGDRLKMIKIPKYPPEFLSNNLIESILLEWEKNN